jgi:hypothetical protein
MLATRLISSMAKEIKNDPFDYRYLQEQARLENITSNKHC